ncbi:MAG TPA: holo-ACP synthase [Blastocatellia bacterium]|nr:holo-ACP synthase [Blastocatellia bacterium]
MIVAIGIDIVEISRMEEVFARQGERFRSRVFTEAEIEYCEGRSARLESYAARFAAKEAVMKALGTGWGEGVAWRDIEVIRAETGAPEIRLRGRALELFDERGARKAHLSLTHSREVAMAQVIFEA